MQWKLARRIRQAVTVLIAGCLLQSACLQTFHREAEVLFQPAASPTLIHNSILLDLFGPRILSLF